MLSYVNVASEFIDFNFVSKELSDKEYAASAEKLATTLQDYNSSKLDRYFFKKYMKKEGIELKNKQLAYELDKWIDNANEKETKQEKEDWEKTWVDYVNVLGKQNKERKNLVSRACRIGFDKDITKVEPVLGDIAVLYADTTGFAQQVLTAKLEVQKANIELVKVSNAATQVQTAINNAKTALNTAKDALKTLEDSTEAQTFIGYCALQGMTKKEVEEMLKNASFDSMTAASTVNLESLYNERGALCNDGTDHTK